MPEEGRMPTTSMGKKKKTPTVAASSSAASGSSRVTRSSARDLELETANPSGGGEREAAARKQKEMKKKLKSPAGPAKKRNVPAPPDREREQMKKRKRKQPDRDSPHTSATDNRKSGLSPALYNWVMEMGKLPRTPASRRDPYTPRREPTVTEVSSLAHKRLVRNFGHSVVNIVSRMPGGSRRVECSGTVVGWNDSTKRAKILTSSAVVCSGGDLLNPTPKLLVHLPNKDISEGYLMFANAHYNIALLEIQTDFTLQLAPLGSNPNDEQKIIALARNEKFSLKARLGTVLWVEPPSCAMYKHYSYLSCDLASSGNGGPVIDLDGNVVGMALRDSPNSALLPISIILTCIDMWNRFSRVARPVLGMSLRAVELLDVSHQDKLEHEHNIDRGFIVDRLLPDSAATSVGIQARDVIISFCGLDCSTIPELEDCLLSLGWKFLESHDSSFTVDLELEVYDAVKRASRRITYPLGFSDVADQVYAYYKMDLASILKK